MPFIFLLLIVCGVFLVASAVSIWMKKVAQIADPILWGPTTGFIGYVVARMLVGDAEVTGVAARLIALFHLLLGLGLMVAGSMCIVAKKHSQPRVTAVEKTQVTEPVPDHGTAFYARTDLEEPEPEVADPSAGDAADAAPQPPQHPQPPVPQGPGTIEPMKEDWMPEGMRRR